jgi:hypothetical protein
VAISDPEADSGTNAAAIVVVVVVLLVLVLIVLWMSDALGTLNSLALTPTPPIR